jgi:uncharacterized membrane-anchored protein
MEAEREVSELRSDLAEYEKRHGMDSAVFLTRFEAGEMGDTPDAIEWASLYRMYMHARERLALLDE